MRRDTYPITEAPVSELLACLLSYDDMTANPLKKTVTSFKAIISNEPLIINNIITLINDVKEMLLGKGKGVDI